MAWLAHMSSISTAKASMMTAPRALSQNFTRDGVVEPDIMLHLQPRRDRGRDHRIDIIARGRKQGNCFLPTLNKVPEEMVGL